MNLRREAIDRYQTWWRKEQEKIILTSFFSACTSSLSLSLAVYPQLSTTMPRLPTMSSNGVFFAASNRHSALLPEAVEKSGPAIPVIDAYPQELIDITVPLPSLSVSFNQGPPELPPVMAHPSIQRFSYVDIPNLVPAASAQYRKEGSLLNEYPRPCVNSPGRLRWVDATLLSRARQSKSIGIGSTISSSILDKSG